MKKINFLIKLRKEKKLSLIEPSEEISKSYLLKSESNLISAKILFSNNKLEESISLSYYSMYNFLLALLFRVGIKSENHQASIILLKELFNQDNSDIIFAKTERIDKQYYVNFNISKEETKKLIKIAEKFNNSLRDFLYKINNKDIREYQRKFVTLLK